MSAANEARQRVAQAMLAGAALLFLIAAFTSAGWRMLALSLGATLLAFSGIMFASIAIINGVPWLVRLLSRLSDPAWDGELLHTDGSEYKIPYDFDEQGSPRFIASAICASVGETPPARGALRCNGIPLLRLGKHVYFTEAGVQSYLAPMATRNHAASRLLLLIRNDVLRKVEKQREHERRSRQEQA